MMQPEMWKVLADFSGKIWAAVGPLIGVGVGSWLTLRTQRKLWVLDNKRAEYRKLLTTLTDCGSNLARVYGHMGGVGGAKEERLVAESARKSANVIFNRLFIAREIIALKIMDRWTTAVSTLQKERNGPAFADTLVGITNDIKREALKDFSK